LINGTSFVGEFLSLPVLEEEIEEEREALITCRFTDRPKEPTRSQRE
jgi:hypothetical protein